MRIKRENPRYNINFLLRIIFYWVIVFTFFIVIRYLEYNSFETITTIGMGSLPLLNQVLFAIPVAIFFGLVFGIYEIYLFPRFLTARNQLVRVIIKSVIYTLTLLIVTMVTYGPRRNVELDFGSEYIEFISSDGFIGITIYVFFFSIIITLINQLYKIMGPGFISDIMLGRYRSPKEEERIFMFIDLNDSTTLTEELGHQKMSELMQDIFGKLSRLLFNYKGELYQFAGDEAVINWPVKKAISMPRCLDFYYAYTDLLKENREYYIDKFGIEPTFKAGVHIGEVMISQIDGYKSQKAFYGDVLNTTARLRGMCKNYERELLASDKLVKRLDLGDKYGYEDLGEAQFKGKISYTNVYAIYRKET